MKLYKLYEEVLGESFLFENYDLDIEKLERDLYNVKSNKDYELISNKIDRLKRLKKMGIKYPDNNLLTDYSEDFKSWFSGGVLVKGGKPIKLYHGSNEEDFKVRCIPSSTTSQSVYYSRFSNSRQS